MSTLVTVPTAGTVQTTWRLGYGLDNRSSIPGRCKNSFSLRHRIQNASRAQPTYAMGAGGSCPVGKAAGP